jgi:membrane protease YdiL (CAAX protease family)
VLAVPTLFRALVKPAFTVSAILLLWFAYTALQTSFVMGYVSEPWMALLGFVPGTVGPGVLWAAGLSRRECFLVVRPLSWRGFVVLFAVFVFALAVILPFSVWQGWSWRAALIYAPASGIAQELFFRGTLLPALKLALRKGRGGQGRRHAAHGWALMIHAVLFGLWHIGPLFLDAPLWAVAAVMFVPFLSGIGWGWQVLRDRTVVWAMVQHSLIWVIGLQFALAV